MKLNKSEVEEIWSWKNLKLKKFEVDEFWSWKIWSWRNLKLKKFEVEKLEVEKFEVEEIWSWGQVQNLFGTYLCIQSTWVLKVKPFFFVFNFAEFRASFALFWAFLGYLMVLWAYFMALWDYYSGRCQVQNQFLELTNEVNQLWFWKYCPIFFVFNSAKFGTFFALLRPFGAIFGGWGKVQNSFGTYLCRKSTLVLEEQS